MRVKLIRHGESVANANRELYYKIRDHEIPLSANGENQARKCGIKLNQILEKEKTKNIVFFYSSYLRCKDTFKLIKEGLNPINIVIEEESPMIREQEYKDFKTEEDFLLKKNEKIEFGEFFYRFKNAESMADTYNRIFNFVNYLITIENKLPKNTTVIIVAHEITIRCFDMIFNSKDYDTKKLDVENCQILEYELNSFGRVCKTKN